MIAIVAENDDRFALSFASFLRKRDIPHFKTTVEEFTRKITIIHDQGVLKISPAYSILLRPLSNSPGLLSEEARFIKNEEFGMIWSIGALNHLPVVNRPNEWGLGKNMSISTVVTERRINHQSLNHERFWHGTETLDLGHMLHQDLYNWQTVPTPDPVGYYRSRINEYCIGWEQVIVVGDKAFRTSTVLMEQDDLEEKSLEITKRLDLSFATLTWGICEEGRSHVLSRINPFPSIYECMPVWDEICESLIKLLTHEDLCDRS